MDEGSGYCGRCREIESVSDGEKIANMVVTGAVIRLYMSRFSCSQHQPTD